MRGGMGRASCGHEDAHQTHDQVEQDGLLEDPRAERRGRHPPSPSLHGSSTETSASGSSRLSGPSRTSETLSLSQSRRSKLTIVLGSSFS